MTSHDDESWSSWDDPLADVARFIGAAPPRAVAEAIYRVYLREQVIEALLERGENPLDSDLSRQFYAEHATELAEAAKRRLLDMCSSIASQEG